MILTLFFFTGKEKEKKELSEWSSDAGSNISQTSSPLIEQSTSTVKVLPIKPKVTVISKRPAQILKQNLEESILKNGIWSPPVLSPPPLGTTYLPAFTSFAKIEEYLEPQVMYNPYFLWQLHSFRMSKTSSVEFSS